MRAKFLMIPFLAAVFLVVFGGISHAATGLENATGGSGWDLLRPVFDAFAHGQYMYAGSIALVLVIAAARRWGSPQNVGQKLSDALRSEIGSAALTFGFSFASTMVAELADGSSPSRAGVWHAFLIGCGALGGYQGIKELLVKPYLAKLANKGPAWLHKPLVLVLWVFSLVGTSDPAPAMPASTSTEQPRPTTGS